MKIFKKDPARQAKEKLLRYLKSKAYPVIPIESETEKEHTDNDPPNVSAVKQKTRQKDPKEIFIHQLKQTLKDPCIFVHLPEENLSEDKLTEE